MSTSAVAPETSGPAAGALGAVEPYQRPVAEVVSTLNSDARRGLTTAEAQRRLTTAGRNELPAPPTTPLWLQFLAQFKNVLTILLLVATVVSLAAWWIERESAIPYEALTILAIVLLNGILGFIQESRAEQAVAALQKLAAPSARVIRGGEARTVATAELVPGDVILLEEGDTIPADARVLQAIALRVAEAALTGESTPDGKDAGSLDGVVPLADRTNMVFSGTAVASGRGQAIVTATGTATEIGKIARQLEQTDDVETPLQKELDRVGKLLGIAVVAIALIVSATILFKERLQELGDLVDVLLIAVSLAVAAVPEGLTAITTIVLSLGTQRMARRNVIVRKLAAVETLGSTTTICSDKTGTLTRNEMTVRTVVTPSGRVDLTGIGYAPTGTLQTPTGEAPSDALVEEVERTLVGGELASNATLSEQDGRWSIQGDPTEGALVVAARKALGADARHRERFDRIGEVPFSSERKLMSTAHTDAESPERVVVFAKGAPDVLLARCHQERVGAEPRPLSAERRAEILRDVEGLASSALRTLGVAYRSVHRDDVTGELTEEIEQAMVWLGVVGMIDPPRAEARAAVDAARTAGIRPVLITGDHPGTAAAIAVELGIAPEGAHAMVGAALQELDDARLKEVVRETSVFARVAPEHKLRIVQALHANGEIAAMTGDGVNDAPALKAADIGVAMGITGTDVAKGASDMILTDDNFASIVAAVEEGRAIFGNIQRFLRYLLSSNIGEVLVMFLGVILASAIGLTPEEGGVVVVPLLATHILWINLLTDSGPALALGVEPADHDVMLRPPRDPRSGVLSARTWMNILLVGVVMAVGTLGVMDWALPGGLLPMGQGGGVRHAQTMGFTTLVFFQLFNALASRFEDHSAFHHFVANRWLWIALAISTALQIAVVYLPFLQTAFRTVPLTLSDWVLCIAVASSVLWVTELRKLMARVR